LLLAQHAATIAHNGFSQQRSDPPSSPREKPNGGDHQHRDNGHDPREASPITDQTRSRSSTWTSAVSRTAPGGLCESRRGCEKGEASQRRK
jgi:hypothetical protein